MISRRGGADNFLFLAAESHISYSWIRAGAAVVAKIHMMISMKEFMLDKVSINRTVLLKVKTNSLFYFPTLFILKHADTLQKIRKNKTFRLNNLSMDGW